MKSLLLQVFSVLLGCVGAKAEVFKTTCVYDDANPKTRFFIIGDSARKVGSTDYYYKDINIGMGNNKSVLEFLSIQNFDKAL